MITNGRTSYDSFSTMRPTLYPSISSALRRSDADVHDKIRGRGPPVMWDNLAMQKEFGFKARPASGCSPFGSVLIGRSRRKVSRSA